MRFAYSPCPNDTFAFYAARKGVVDGPDFEVEHHDVETLNRRAFDGRYEVTKLSFRGLSGGYSATTRFCARAALLDAESVLSSSHART